MICEYSQIVEINALKAGNSEKLFKEVRFFRKNRSFIENKNPKYKDCTIEQIIAAKPTEILSVTGCVKFSFFTVLKTRAFLHVFVKLPQQLMEHLAP